MTFRKLRITWSVAWGLAAVLLVACWIKSYKVGAYVRWDVGARTFYAVAEEGELETVVFGFPLEDNEVGLRVPQKSNSMPIAELLGVRVVYVSGFYSGITLPYWTGLVASVAMAGAAWFPNVGRFSLRTLLIATTLVAAVLGLIVWSVSPN